MMKSVCSSTVEASHLRRSVISAELNSFMNCSRDVQGEWRFFAMAGGVAPLRVA